MYDERKTHEIRRVVALKASRPREEEWHEMESVPEGCMPSEQFWKLTYEDRTHYKDKVEEFLGYLPTPYTVSYTHLTLPTNREV